MATTAPKKRTAPAIRPTNCFNGTFEASAATTTALSRTASGTGARAKPTARRAARNPIVLASGLIDWSNPEADDTCSDATVLAIVDRIRRSVRSSQAFFGFEATMHPGFGSANHAGMEPNLERIGIACAATG